MLVLACCPVSEPYRGLSARAVQSAGLNLTGRICRFDRPQRARPLAPFLALQQELVQSSRLVEFSRLLRKPGRCSSRLSPNRTGSPSCASHPPGTATTWWAQPRSRPPARTPAGAAPAGCGQTPRRRPHRAGRAALRRSASGRLPLQPRSPTRARQAGPPAPGRSPIRARELPFARRLARIARGSRPCRRPGRTRARSHPPSRYVLTRPPPALSTARRPDAGQQRIAHPDGAVFQDERCAGSGRRRGAQADEESGRVQRRAAPRPGSLSRGSDSMRPTA